ncbi:MAG: hypothetical protein KAH18_08040 [Psychromonas sp.]|nr:hypothetical protein [Psychromonas sp.]
MITNKSLKIISLFLSAFIITGCGSDEKQKTSEVTPAASHTAQNMFQGTWIVNCRQSNRFHNTKYTSTIEFTGNKMEQVSKYYYGPYSNNCTRYHLFDTKVSRVVVFREVVNKGTNNEYTKIDSTATKVEQTIIRGVVLTTLNAKFNYLGVAVGFTDWKLNEPKDVTDSLFFLDNISGRTGNPFNVGNTVLDIIKMSDDTMSFGDHDGNLDSERRPLILDSTQSFPRKVD